MLYDPKWEMPDRVYDRVSLRAFIAWLETKPANESYVYIVSSECALGQFMKAQGYSGEDCCIDLAPEESDWLNEIVQTRPQTFGGCLERARAALG